MSLNNTKSGLKNLLTALLAQANQDQNAFLPPYIFSSFVNTVTSFLIDKCVEVYPTSSRVIEIIDPFVKVSAIVPSNGIIKLPDDFRNILGSPGIVVKNDKKGECGDSGVPITNAQQFLAATVKGGCTRRPITVVSQSEFDYLTTSSYKKPTFWNPICFNKGENELKVCPTDVTKVYVLYVKKEQVYNYGYVVQPDDIFYIDEDTTVDTEWGAPAFTPLMRGLTALYGVYSRDKEFTNWSLTLSQIPLL